MDGDDIVVGTDEVTITDIDYSANIITVDQSISWSDGDPVSLSYNGDAPDIGAKESPYSSETDTETIVSIDPSSQSVSAGDTFTINVSCVPGQPIKSFELNISFDPSLLTANSVTEGDIFDGYTTYFNSGTIYFNWST